MLVVRTEPVLHQWSQIRPWYFCSGQEGIQSQDFNYKRKFFKRYKVEELGSGNKLQKQKKVLGAQKREEYSELFEKSIGWKWAKGENGDISITVNNKMKEKIKIEM